MIEQYIKENYQYGEPIFLKDLPCSSKAYLRQQMKILVDKGVLLREYNGVYILNYTTILGTKGKMSIDKFMKNKYLTSKTGTIGYFCGITLLNTFGFTSQNPSTYEITSNAATTKQRKLSINNFNIIIYKPYIDITDKNISALQFLDLMLNIDKYSEIKGDELKAKLKEFIRIQKVNFEEVKKIIKFYPDKVFRNIYNGGIIDKLV